MKKHITIVYDPKNGHVVPDKFVEFYCESVLQGHFSEIDGKTVIEVGSSTLLNALRALMVEQELYIDKVVFVTGDNRGNIDIVPNPDGTINHWPDGFCDVDEKILLRIFNRINS